jgi:hypothetical protein
MGLARKGHSEQDSQNRIGRMGQAERNKNFRQGRARQAERVRQNMTGRKVFAEIYFSDLANLCKIGLLIYNFHQFGKN